MRLQYPLILSTMILFLFIQGKTPIQLKGHVFNEEDKPVTGAHIMVKGSKSGTITDSTGSFSLNVSTLPTVLLISALGYESREFPVDDKKTAGELVVKLSTYKAAMEEVVITGYGIATAKKDMVASAPITVRGISSKAAGISVSSGRRKEMVIDKVMTPDKPMEHSSDEKIEPHSNLLTAGELSDFKKWKLWSDYTEKEFREYGEHWKLFPRQRYCVQIQNETRQAIAGEKVYLVNADTKDTVWQGITDNTGKAELWAAMSEGEDQQGRYSISCNNQLVPLAQEFKKGINQITINQPCNASNDVDIAFVVDATGSMGDEIRYLQAELADIISHVAGKYKEINLRLGSVFYRDHGDEYLTRPLDFQSDPLALLQFIKNQSAMGGGDTPEAVDAALSSALEDLHWKEGARSKILFLILDAPPHDDARDKIDAQVRLAAKKGIRIIPVVCSGIDKSTEYLMRSIALATNGSYVFLTDDSGVGNKHIKPTTDEFRVELLNALVQRLIGEMIYMPTCNGIDDRKEPVNDLVKNTGKVVIFPNPSSGNITIEAPLPVKEIYLADFAGKLLKRMQITGKQTKWQLDLGNHPAGTYLVKYFMEDKGWGAEKLVLVR
ncbi:MAG TPA: carboxypeptidase-like regulatory domain-containing protein [Flavisolibacter sp.]|nr:carboxypeptidase-like regulatory domain-containing protein [Flavisolibacter sp.]